MIHFFKSLNSVWFEASTWLKLLFFKIRPKKFLQKRVWKIVQIFAFFVWWITILMCDFLGKNDKEAENVSFSALTHRVKFQLEICNFTNWLFEPCGKYHTGAWLNYLSFNGILLKVINTQTRKNWADVMITFHIMLGWKIKPSLHRRPWHFASVSF